MTQTTTRSQDPDVLIAGAGPTGLVLALWLTRLGVRVRIVDKTSEPGTTSRALAVQARTLELYDQIELAQAVVDHSRKAMAANLWVAGVHEARVPFGDMGRGLSPFPYAVIFPQDEHERMLVEQLRRRGVEVDRQTELVAFDEVGDRIRARLKTNGAEETCECAFIAGCDGARSLVRERLGIGFPGGTYDHLFYVADVDASGPAINGEIHIQFEPADFLVVFPLKDEGRARLIGTVCESPAATRELTWDDVSRTAIEGLRVSVKQVHWFSTYHVHHRVADRFRQGRAFLLGDAAHIHSPVGGQGMNTGIGDAVNLAWKLAAVLCGRAHASILESYEPERIAFARRLVRTTDEAFTAVTSPSKLAKLIRMDAVPALLPRLVSLPAVRRVMFRTISQTSIEYRDSALSAGRAGRVHGGDRLPWVEHADGLTDNFAALRSTDWQVHVYGEADDALRACCGTRGIPLHAFPWRPEMRRVGLRRNACYLVRPDGYIGLANADARAEALIEYLDAHGIVAGAVSQ